MIPSRRAAGVLLAVYLFAVALIVFWPTTAMNDASISGIWVVLHALGAPAWVSPNGIEFLSNVLFLMPLSFLGSVFRPGWGWARWLAAGFTLSATIELSQLLFLSGRVASIRDVVANTLGAALGYAIVATARRL